MKIWQRHILSHLIKTFLFLLICFFLLYVLVDLSVHGLRFLNAPLSSLALYYLQTFAIHLDLFLSLAFLLSTLKILFHLNSHRELIALQMAGLSRKKLLLPFFLLAGILSLLSYLNSQWLIPHVQEETYAFRKPHKQPKLVNLYSVSLEDDSELVYQGFDQNGLFDVFWIRTPNDIWHMKTLQISGPPIGHFVDHLIRNSAKQLEKAESFAYKEFPEIHWELPTLLPFKSRPLSLLFSQSFTPSSDRPSILTHLSYKLVAPLVPILLLFAIAPFLMRFSRKEQFFLIAACSLFGLVAAKVILDGMLVLGENQVLPSLTAILVPFALMLTCSLYSYVKMK